jgi:hypothetical protein
MSDAGGREILAWTFEEEATEAEHSFDNTAKSARYRQREQKKRDEANGKVKCSIKTAGDEESKELIRAVAKAFIDARSDGSTHFHEGVRAVLDDPASTLIGARVMALRGWRRAVVFSLIRWR